jgi:hypothetical protein
LTSSSLSGSFSRLTSSAFRPQCRFFLRCRVDSVASRRRQTSAKVCSWARSFSPSARFQITYPRRVPAPLHRAALLAPFWNTGLVQRMDEFTGTRSPPPDSPRKSPSRPPRNYLLFSGFPQQSFQRPNLTPLRHRAPQPAPRLRRRYAATPTSLARGKCPMTVGASPPIR